MATILVIDDQSRPRDHLATVVANGRHFPLQAADLTEGLALARSALPDLVLVHILNPRVDDYAVLFQLGIDPALKFVPVILYTALDHKHEAQAFSHAGRVFHVLTEPCEPETLLRTVAEALEVSPIPALPMLEDLERDQVHRWADRIPFEADELTRVSDLLIREVAQRKRAERALEQCAERLNALSGRFVEVQEEERRHFARELHDDFAQILATAALHLHAAWSLTRGTGRAQLDKCATLLEQAGKQVRTMAHELRTPDLEVFGLEASLRRLAEHHQQRTGCLAQVVGHLSEARVPSETAFACFRVTQEALRNVARHAAARHVWIELSECGCALELLVRDDGAGFDVVVTHQQAALRERLGLLGMAERMQLLGGSLRVVSKPGHGTRIRASFPLNEVPHQPVGPIA